MGLLLSRLYAVYTDMFNGEPSRILMLGLDAAGKTTILYKLKLNETVSTIPTIGFNVETVSPVKGLTFTVWDIGGQKRIRDLWRHYFRSSHGLVFVVDSVDKERVEDAREELFGIMEHAEMRDVPLVVLANKQDLPGAMKPYELIDSLQLRNLVGHKWHMQGACAPSGEGVYEGMQEMAKLVKDFKNNHAGR